jgi:SAM-dependent methyltransferase
VALSATEDKTRAAYDAFAPFYDSFTAHHDYELWVSGLLDLAYRYGLSGMRALDAGCGTGKSFLPLVERGFEVSACDQSPAMLAKAASKASADVTLHCGDLRRLEALGEFDLITCLDDVANHLMTPGELTAALGGLARNLRRGGVLLFDANTVATYRTFFRATFVVEHPGLLLLWRGLAPEDFDAGGQAAGSLDGFIETGDGWIRSTSRHEQRHHAQTTIERCVARAGLRVLAAYGQDPQVNFEPRIDELRHSKAVYVVTR